MQNGVSPAMCATISEVATWCSHREGSTPLFRSPELDPFGILDIPSFSESSQSIDLWIETKRDCYRRATEWINLERSKLLGEARLQALSLAEAISRNKLLIYAPLETVEDGAAEAASRGFYDILDAPPWDTWLLYSDGVVFCCVPEFAIPRAQDGIDANPVDCIHWADWSRLARVEARQSTSIFE